MLIEVASARALVADYLRRANLGVESMDPDETREMLGYLTAAFDEVEQLRARVSKLEAVVHALPRCQTWYGDFSKCDKIASRIGACDADPGYCCDGHKCRHTCPDLPYADALRALEEACALPEQPMLAVTPLRDGWVEDARVAVGQRRRGRSGEEARMLAHGSHDGVDGWAADVGGKCVWISAASVPARWPYRASEEP